MSDILELLKHLPPHLKFLDFLGQGSFGVVAKCFDTTRRHNVALKVPKNHGDSDVAEVTFLRRILRLGLNPDQVRIVRYLDLVWLRATPCLVLECLGENLHQMFRDVELGVSHVRSIGRQLIMAISCLKANGIVHGDIKPHNILFTGMHKEAIGIKLADLGGFMVDQWNPPRVHHEITTLFYRSPEVLVGLRSSFPIDMWAVALTLVELFSGRCLFPAQTEMDLMHFMSRLLGIDDCFLGGEFLHKFFVEGELTLKEHDKPEEKTVLALEQLLQVVQNCSEIEKADTWVFLCFIKRALDLNPSKRITCEESFFHDFFTLHHFTDEHMEYHKDVLMKTFPL